MGSKSLEHLFGMPAQRAVIEGEDDLSLAQEAVFVVLLPEAGTARGVELDDPADAEPLRAWSARPLLRRAGPLRLGRRAAVASLVDQDAGRERGSNSKDGDAKRASCRSWRGHGELVMPLDPSPPRRAQASLDAGSSSQRLSH